MASFTIVPEVLAAYEHRLMRQPLSDHTRRTYLKQVNRYCTYLSTPHWEDGHPLQKPHARDYAVRDYKTALKVVHHAKPSSANLAQAVVDHSTAFLNYRRLKWHAKTCPDRLLAPWSHQSKSDFCERWSAAHQCGIARLHSCCSTRAYVSVIAQCKKLVGHHNEPVLFLTKQGTRLATRTIDDVVRRLGQDANHSLSTHILRHTCLISLVRNGNDLVLVAELAGHRQLETTRRYSLPSAADRDERRDTPQTPRHADRRFGTRAHDCRTQATDEGVHSPTFTTAPVARIVPALQESSPHPPRWLTS